MDRDGEKVALLFLLRTDAPDPVELLQSWSLGEALPRPELNATAGIGRTEIRAGSTIFPPPPPPRCCSL